MSRPEPAAIPPRAGKTPYGGLRLGGRSSIFPTVLLGVLGPSPSAALAVLVGVLGVLGAAVGLVGVDLGRLLGPGASSALGAALVVALGASLGVVVTGLGASAFASVTLVFTAFST